MEIIISSNSFPTCKTFKKASVTINVFFSFFRYAGKGMQVYFCFGSHSDVLPCMLCNSCSVLVNSLSVAIIFHTTDAVFLKTKVPLLCLKKT